MMGVKDSQLPVIKFSLVPDKMEKIRVFLKLNLIYLKACSLF